MIIITLVILKEYISYWQSGKCFTLHANVRFLVQTVQYIGKHVRRFSSLLYYMATINLCFTSRLVINV